MRTRIIIGLSGRARSGKDSIAGYLHDEYQFAHMAFAGPLKDAARCIFSLSQEQLYGDKKEVVDERWGKSPRQILQLLGTECVRNVFGSDTWVKACKAQIDVLPAVTVGVGDILAQQRGERAEQPYGHTFQRPVVISDVRFPSEADAIRSWGGEVWRVERDGILPVAAHSSETALDDYPHFARRIKNNSTIRALHLDLSAALMNMRSTA